MLLDISKCYSNIKNLFRNNPIVVPKESVKQLCIPNIKKCYLIIDSILINLDITRVHEDYTREVMDHEAFYLLCDRAKNVRAFKTPYGFNPEKIFFEL